MPNKQEILNEIKSAPLYKRHLVAEKHGGVLINVGCNTPKCDYRIGDQYVEVGKDGDLGDAVRNHICPKCGARALKPVARPAPSADDIKKGQAIEARDAEDNRKARLEKLDAEIKALNAERALHLPKKADAKA